MKKLFALCLVAMLAFAAIPVNARAEEAVSTYIYVPTSYLEYYNLSSPVYIYCDDEIVAISEYDSSSEDMERVIVYYRNEELFRTTEYVFSAPDKIERSGDYLYIHDGYYIYALNIHENEGEYLKATRLSLLALNFSINGRFLVVANLSNIETYDISLLNYDFQGAVKESSTIAFEIGYSTPVYVNEDGLIYYTTKTVDNLYYLHASDGRSIILDEAIDFFTVLNDKVYYIDSYLQLHENDLNTDRIIHTFTKGDDLGYLSSPRGIKAYGDKLYITDSAINAIQEFDLTKTEWTEFAITADSDAINRLTSYAADITMTEDTLFIADRNRVMIIRDIEGKKEFSRINLDKSFTPTDIASNGKYVLLSGGSRLQLIKISDEKDSDATVVLDSKEYNNIVSVTVVDDVFYFVYNILRSDNITYGVVAKIDTSKETPVIESTNITLDRTNLMTADIFGNLYFASAENKISRYDAASGAISDVWTSLAGNIIKLQCDFDGNCYLLSDKNEIISINGNAKETKKIILSDNLPLTATAKSMCMNYSNKTAYILYNGFIVMTTNMNLATPSDVLTKLSGTVKTGLDLDLTVGVANGAKLFTFDYSDLDGKNAKAIKSYTFLNDKRLFIIGGDDNFSIALTEDNGKILTCMVKTDAINKTAKNDYSFAVPTKFTDSVGYTTSNVNLYNYPLLLTELSSGVRLEERESLIIRAKLNILGTEFYLVKRSNGTSGYVPAKFIVESNAIELTQTVFTYSAVILKNGQPVNVYSNAMLSSKSFTIDRDATVKLLKRENGKAYIEYNGNLGYIDEYYLGEYGSSAVRNSLIIIIAAFAVTVTSIFLVLKRK